MDARWISEPLCLFDNCLETDGALAVVVTSAERARDLPPAARVHPLVRAGPPAAAPDDDQLLQRRPAARARRGPRRERLWANADVAPADVKVAQLYDAFSPLIPLSLEGYGFCERGEGGPFTDDGAHRVARRPAARRTPRAAACREAYVHGFNLVLEGVRQIRGTSTVAGRRRRRVARDERRRRPDVARSSSRGARLTWRPSWLLPDLDEPTSRAVLGRHRARRAARAGVRRRAARGACRRGRCARTAGRSTCSGSRRRAAAAIWSFVVPHPPLLPAYAELAPYNVIVVELDEDPTIRFVGNLVDRAPTARSTRSTPRRSTIGEPVRVVFHQVDDVTLPRWVRRVSRAPGPERRARESRGCPAGIGAGLWRDDPARPVGGGIRPAPTASMRWIRGRRQAA